MLMLSLIKLIPNSSGLATDSESAPQEADCVIFPGIGVLE